MLSHAATLLLSVGDIMGFNSPEQFTSHSPLPVDGGERKFDQPCGIRGSWGIYNPPKTSPPSLRHGVSTTLRRHRVAAAAAAAAALACRKEG